MKFLDWLEKHGAAYGCFLVFMWVVGLPGLFIGVGLLFGPSVGGLFLIGCVGAGAAVHIHHENESTRRESRWREEHFNSLDKQEPPTTT